MMTLSLNSEDCSDCGRCEVFIPGLVEKLEPGPMMINEQNPNVDWQVINGAIKACLIGALEIT